MKMVFEFCSRKRYAYFSQIICSELSCLFILHVKDLEPWGGNAIIARLENVTVEPGVCLSPM